MFDNFTLAELIESEKAKKANISNIPDFTEVINLLNLVSSVLQPARDWWKKTITINSGYRSPKLNTLVKGAKNSDHMLGCACDITTGTKVGNKKLYAYIRDNLQFDQLIDEYDYTWIHVSYKAKGNRKQVFAIK